MHSKQTKVIRRTTRLRNVAVSLLLGLIILPAAGLTAVFNTGAVSAAPPSTVADDQGNCPDGKKTLPKGDCSAALPDQKITSTCPRGGCIIQKYINPIVNTIAAMVGIAVTISIIIGGIRYATSADNPQKVSEAKQRILTSLMVLVGFFVFYAFLNYIIPGGLVSGL